MPSEQHEQWKRDLFNHLERKLNGCIGCGLGEDPKDHLPVHKGHQYDPSQQIIWTCEQMHPHVLGVFQEAPGEPGVQRVGPRDRGGEVVDDQVPGDAAEEGPGRLQSLDDGSRLGRTRAASWTNSSPLLTATGRFWTLR